MLSHYADLAHAKYEDSLISARTLQGAVNQFIAEPTEANLAAAQRRRGSQSRDPLSAE